MEFGLQHFSFKQVDLGIGGRRYTPCTQYGLNVFFMGGELGSYFGVGGELGVHALRIAVNAYLPIEFSKPSEGTLSQVVYYPLPPPDHQELQLWALKPTTGIDFRVELHPSFVPFFSGGICVAYQEGLQLFQAQNVLKPHGVRSSAYCRFSPFSCFSIGVQYDLDDAGLRRNRFRIFSIQAQLRFKQSWKQHLRPPKAALNQTRSTFVNRRHERALCCEPMAPGEIPKHLDARWKHLVAALFECYCELQGAPDTLAKIKLELELYLGSLRADKVITTKHRQGLYHALSRAGFHPDKLSSACVEFFENKPFNLPVRVQAIFYELCALSMKGLPDILNDSKGLQAFYASLNLPEARPPATEPWKASLDNIPRAWIGT